GAGAASRCCARRWRGVPTCWIAPGSTTTTGSSCARSDGRHASAADRAMADLYVALLHHPVYDKTGAGVTTAVTNLDVHDIARLARTFGVRAFYVCTPVATLRRLVARIIRHWDVGPGASYNATRREALALVRQAPELDAAIAEIERETGQLPRLIATS